MERTLRLGARRVNAPTGRTLNRRARRRVDDAEPLLEGLLDWPLGWLRPGPREQGRSRAWRLEAWPGFSSAGSTEPTATSRRARMGGGYSRPSRRPASRATRRRVALRCAACCRPMKHDGSGNCSTTDPELLTLLAKLDARRVQVESLAHLLAFPRASSARVAEAGPGCEKNRGSSSAGSRLQRLQVRSGVPWLQAQRRSPAASRILGGWDEARLGPRSGSPTAEETCLGRVVHLVQLSMAIKN